MLQARPYQVEIADLARNESIIAKLGTGLGKTYIAVMTIKVHLPETYRSISKGGKRILFVAKTVHLVHQHAEFLRTQLPVKSEEIGIFHGQVSPSVWIDSWTPNIWQEQLEKHRVLVITAGVLRDVLNHGKVTLRNVCLLIMDECHHADPSSKSDFTEVCLHLHNFPPGKWLPDYSRGPKVLGLTASIVNSLKLGDDLTSKMQSLERLMRAHIVTSTDSSIDVETGLRQIYISPYNHNACILTQDSYHPFAQALACGVEKLSQFADSMKDDYLDLESLLDDGGRIKKELFLSCINLNFFSSKKMKRLPQQCIKVLEDYGVYPAACACEQSIKAVQALLKSDHWVEFSDPRCFNILQVCFITLSNALNIYRRIHQASTTDLTSPPTANLNDPDWEDWVKAHFPMTDKSILLLRLLLRFYQQAKTNNETFSALVLVKERITSNCLAHLISDVAETVPLFAHFKASFCVSSNPGGVMISMPAGEQTAVLDGFRKGLFNILVATNVVEEGLDVRACNVVIKADDLTNIRSFIQSQGRARAKTSHFVLMTEDRYKCKSDVKTFLQQAKMINASIVSRCIDNIQKENEEDELVENEDVTRPIQHAYMPYGESGPRISISNAASVLMRFVSLLKTDTSYPLKILYSIDRNNFAYRARLLFPPSSQLQEIISGPWCSNKEMAKQLLRLEACKRLHKTGLLGTDLLPINYPRLISMSKASNSSEHSDKEQLQAIISEIKQMTFGNLWDKTETGGLSIMSQANLRLVPIQGDILSEISPVLENPSNGNEGGEDTESHDDELPLGIIMLHNTSSFGASDSVPAVNFEHIKGPGLSATPKSTSTPTNQLEVFNNHVMDEELPVKRQTGASRSLNKARFYEIQRLSSLSAPYQQPIVANQPAYLYTWKLPSPVHVAHLCKVDPACFRPIDQTIGFLFSKPISKSAFVCRVPLYMQSGMMRVRLRRTATLQLTKNQLELAHSTHQVLSELSVEINKPINFNINYSRDQISFFTSSSTSHTDVVDPVLPVSIDPFSELKVDPLGAQICALLVIVRLPANHLDEEASRSLVHWAQMRDFYVHKKGKRPVPHLPGDPLLQSGICKYYGVNLDAVPVSQWAGLLVRPIYLPPGDPGSFTVSGANADGLCASSRVPDRMAARVPAELTQSGVVTYLDYSQFKYGTVFHMVHKIRSIDAATPLAAVMRISRHRNAANIMSGIRITSKDVAREDRIPQLCVVHPLNTWLWLTLCLTPTVLHQVYRCLSVNDFENHLYNLLYADTASNSSPSPKHSIAIPVGDFLMPDRFSMPLIYTPSMRKYLVQDDDALWRLKEPDLVFSLDSESVLDRAAEEKCQPKRSACLPPTSGLYEAVTSLNAFEAVNLERLELLGDSFLKFVCSLVPFATSPSSTSEGLLTYSRASYISNSNLHRISTKFGLFRYFCSCSFRPELHYLPPYYSLADPVKARERHDPRVFAKIHDKSIADSVEALLGVFLLNLEWPRVARLLYLLGLSNEPKPLDALSREGSVANMTYHSWVPLLLSSEFRTIDPSFSADDMEVMAMRHVEVENFLRSSLPITSAGKSSDSESEPVVYKEFSEILSEKRSELRQLENIIGYNFKRIRILLQAITHPSSCLALKWGCYQRLEFLGDAILDFVVTRRIYEDHPNMDPCQLTDLRVALVSNTNLAVVSVRTGIYKFLDYADSSLWTFINNFCNAVFLGVSNIWQLENDCNERNDVLSYKVLGDMLEAIIGAVFVDSGGATSAVTGVIYHLLKFDFEVYGKDLPVDPLRLMHEIYPELEISCKEATVAFDVADSRDSNNVLVSGGGQRRRRVIAVVDFKGQKLTGEGFNSRTAKLQIARQLGIGFS